MKTPTPRTCECGIQFLAAEDERLCFFCKASEPQASIAYADGIGRQRHRDARRLNGNTSRDPHGRPINPNATYRTVKRRDYQRSWKAKRQASEHQASIADADGVGRQYQEQDT
jgi:hypothetical protein